MAAAPAASPAPALAPAEQLAVSARSLPTPKPKTKAELEDEAFTQLLGQRVISTVSTNNKEWLLKWAQHQIGTRDHSHCSPNYPWASAWADFSPMQQVATDLLSMPATEASSERLFSKMTKLDKATYGRLKDSTWIYITFLKANLDLVIATFGGEDEPENTGGFDDIDDVDCMAE